MKYIDADLIKSTQSLYSDIDSCIDELLKARIEHNQENEGKALFRMEGLMVGTLQQLSCIIDSLQQDLQKVDLEKESLKYFIEIQVKDDETPILCDFKFKVNFATIARHFYELGKNSK